MPPKMEDRTYTVSPALPLSEKSKRYVRKRVEMSYGVIVYLRTMCKICQKRNEGTYDEDELEIILLKIRQDREDKLKIMYNRGILYWKERGDMENSNRSAYALYYLMNVARHRNLLQKEIQSRFKT